MGTEKTLEEQMVDLANEVSVNIPVMPSTVLERLHSLIGSELMDRHVTMDHTRGKS